MNQASVKPHQPAIDTLTVRAALVELQNSLQKKYGGQAPTLLLYGSYARGDASIESDVDVVLLYPRDVQPGHEINQLREILSELNLRYQILISILPVKEQQYRKSQTAFWKNVRQEAVGIDRV